MECQRCGTCCRKGPPGLHIVDKELYFSGIFEKSHLLTLRKGERVYDNIKGQKVTLAEEMVRLRSKDNQRTCLFFDDSTSSCSRYAHRPVECRVMKCWDTREIEDIYKKDRLKRLDLISAASALGEIIEEHEKRCSIESIQSALTEIRVSSDSTAGQKIADIVSVDRRFREYMQEQAGTDKHTLNFLFGRPVIDILKLLGVEIRDTGQGIKIIDSSSPL